MYFQMIKLLASIFKKKMTLNALGFHFTFIVLTFKTLVVIEDYQKAALTESIFD